MAFEQPLIERLTHCINPGFADNVDQQDGVLALNVLMISCSIDLYIT